MSSKNDLLGEVAIDVKHGNLFLICEYSYPDQESSENWVNLLDINDMVYYTVNIEQFQLNHERFQYFVVDGKYKERLIKALDGVHPEYWPA
ncbi:MAG: hypothetical protein C5B49_01880 [Bdellovibrio sp.]|nr:MAG: hypothetical protein C5B49_01880 [Bdellovibrio sp.]